MASVLHLSDEPCDYQTRMGIAQLTARDSSQRHLTVGRGGDFSNPFMALLKLRREAGSFDVVHAWGGESLMVAAVSGGIKRIVYSPTCFPNHRDHRLIRAIMSVRNVNIICGTDTMRRAFVEHGTPIQRCHLVRPGVDFSRAQRKGRDELRAKLGFAKDDFVLLAMGESTHGANHHMTILGATVLAVLEKKYKLLLWGRGPKADVERRFCSLMLNLKHTVMATDALGRDVEFDQLLPAADAALLTADRPIPTLPIAVCMAGALPIITTVSRTVAELLEDRHNCLMAKKSTGRWIARRVLDLVEDPKLRWTITDTARTEAFEYFSMTRFVEQMKTVYERFSADAPIELPPIRAGAGSRFAGRV
jgi:glycosyltransferase involved in cell wall biosynthesis